MTNPHIKDIVKQIVLADNDDEIRAIAVVFITRSGEPEIQYAVDNIHAYSLNFGLDVIKAGLVSDVLRNASQPVKYRK